jgi:hypothetical protein
VISGKFSHSPCYRAPSSLRELLDYREKVVDNDDPNQVKIPKRVWPSKHSEKIMQDVAHFSSMAIAYNESIQKADASLLAMSPGSKIVDPLDSSSSNISTAAEILENISRFRNNVIFVISSIKHYVDSRTWWKSESASPKQIPDDSERAITGSWFRFFQSTEAEDIVDTICNMLP